MNQNRIQADPKDALSSECRGNRLAITSDSGGVRGGDRDVGLPVDSH